MQVVFFKAKKTTAFRHAHILLPHLPLFVSACTVTA